MNEQYRQNLKFTTASGDTAVTAANTWHADIRDNVNTFMAAVNWAAIPEKLDFRLSYTVSLSNDSQPINSDAGAQPHARQPRQAGSSPTSEVNGRGWKPWPSTPSTRTRSASMGFNGEAYAKLRYVWERNSVNNFDQDIMQAYMNPLINNTGFMTWMAYNNPNYNVQLIGASLGLKW